MNQHSNENLPSVLRERSIRTEGVVKWRNELVESRYASTEAEMKLLIALSAQINSSSDHFDYTVVSAKELGALMMLNAEGTYSFLEKVANKLFDRVVTFKSLEKMSDGRSKTEEKYHIFEYLKYLRGQGAIGFKFSSAVAPLLLQVKSAYVQTPIETAMQLKGPYSNRLFMAVMQWEKLSPYTVALDDLRDRFQTGSKYKNNAEFVRSVIDYSVQQINMYTYYNISVEALKSGRKISHIKFFIRKKTAAAQPAIDVTPEYPVKEYSKPKEKIEVPLEWSNVQKDTYDELVRYGISKNIAKKFIQEKTLFVIKSNIDYVKDIEKKGKLKGTFAAYLNTAITDDYAGTNARIAEQEARAAELKKQEKLAAMSPEEREDYEEHEKWFREMNEAMNNPNKNQKEFGPYEPLF